MQIGRSCENVLLAGLSRADSSVQNFSIEEHTLALKIKKIMIIVRSIILRNKYYRLSTLYWSGLFSIFVQFLSVMHDNIFYRIRNPLKAQLEIKLKIVYVGGCIVYSIFQ